MKSLIRYLFGIQLLITTISVVRVQAQDPYIIPIAVTLLVSNSSTTRGTISPSSHYVYPNSNVTPLGSTNSRVKKFGFIFPPKFKARDLDKLYGTALSKYQGADLILDNKVDTKFTTILFFFHSMKVTVSGTAAHMEIGKQDIGQNNFTTSNDSGANSTGYVNSTLQTPPAETVLPPREPFKSARIGLQYSRVLNSEMINPVTGINFEFFVGRKMTVVPSVSYSQPRRSDKGYGLGTFETRQICINMDTHGYLLDKMVSIYLISGVSAECLFYDEGWGNNHLDLGFSAGLGLSGNLFSGRLIPFTEGKYTSLANLTDSPEELRIKSGPRVSFGIRMAFHK